MSDRNFYKEGYRTGYKWKEDYRPGGPYRCTDKQRYPDMYAKDLANSKEWFEGFDHGLKRREIAKRLKA